MVTEQFNVILERERMNDLIPFLKSLTKEDKKIFAPELKKIAKDYLEYKQSVNLVGQYSVKQKASPTQARILEAAALATLNRKDFEKVDTSGNLLQHELLNEVLQVNCPDWFSDYINGFTKTWVPWHFRYEHAIQLSEKGYLEPSDELIVRLIPQMMFDRGENHKQIFSPQNLVRYDITLQKHFWLIFQYESSIHFSDRYSQFQNIEKTDNLWQKTIKECSDSGKIERLRLLRESILATSRNFNKALSGWFIDLFDVLEPTPEEIIALQPELFVVLSSQHSKAVNCVLGSLKKVVDSKEFNSNSLIENTPVLLSSETKTVVSSTLTLLEKVAKNNPARKEEICIAICQAFIHSDENIQSKASKSLLKLNDNYESVSAEINKYSDSLLMSSKKALAELISQDTSVPAASPEVRGEVSSFAPKPLPEIKTLDELIFLASQAFDNNDPMHIDLLPAALVNLQDELTPAALPKFAPALQRAYNMVVSWGSAMGYFDHLLSTFFIDLMRLLVSRHPQAGAPLQAIHDSFRIQNAENTLKFSHYQRSILELQTWGVHSRDTTYNIHKSILMEAYLKISNQQRVQLLSTPTHEFGYVDPVILVRRVASYQSKDLLADNFDFQAAISRVAPFHHEEALSEARKTLKGEALAVLEFLLKKDARPPLSFVNPELWFMAAIAKSPTEVFPELSNSFYATLPRAMFSGEVEWKSFVEHYKATRYNYQTRKNEEVEEKRNVLRVTIAGAYGPKDPEKPAGVLSKISNWFSRSASPAERTEDPIIYELLTLKGQWLNAEENDIQRFIYLFPNNPDRILALIASRVLTLGTFTSEIEKRIVIRALEALIHLRFRYSEMTHLFVATCMLTSDKTARSFAAEMWVNAVRLGMVDSARVGKMIGMHLSIEYAPMKRFTDLVSSNLLQISKQHNAELEKLLTAVLMELPGDPPVGMKRLLEIYSEVLAINNSSVKSDVVRSKLEGWAVAGSLKKIVGSLV